MDYPNLLIAVRRSGLKQYEIARAAGLREGRLSMILRRGAATVEEQDALCRVLSTARDILFDVAAEQPVAGQCEGQGTLRKATGTR